MGHHVHACVGGIFFVHPLHCAVGMLNRCPFGQGPSRMSGRCEQPSKPQRHEGNRAVTMDVLDVQHGQPCVARKVTPCVALADGSCLVGIVHRRGRRPNQQRHPCPLGGGVQCLVKCVHMFFSATGWNGDHPMAGAKRLKVGPRGARRPTPRQHFHTETSERPFRVDLSGRGKDVVAAAFQRFGHPCAHATCTQHQHLGWGLCHRLWILKTHWHKDCDCVRTSHYIWASNLDPCRFNL